MTANAQDADDWNGASGRHFVEQRVRWERMRSRMTTRLLAAAQIGDGDEVLDVGCGCGDTTILAARACGSGHALGADISRIEIAEARRLAATEGVANADFEVIDVQTHPFKAADFDVALSCFGVMFFDDATAAFGNVRTALRRGGRFAFLCWRARAENPYFGFGYAATAVELGMCEDPGPDEAFSLADKRRVVAMLAATGFGDIAATAVDEPMQLGRSVDDVLQYERTYASAQRVLTGLAPERAEQLDRRVRDRMAPYVSQDGVVFPGAAWLVTARAV